MILILKSVMLNLFLKENFIDASLRIILFNCPNCW